MSSLLTVEDIKPCFVCGESVPMNGSSDSGWKMTSGYDGSVHWLHQACVSHIGGA